MILLVGVLAVVFVRADVDRPFQSRNIRTAAVVLGTSGGLLFWLLLLSRLPWRRRGAILAGVVGCLGLLWVLVRIEGVSGDLVPQLTWRWTPPKSATVRSTATPVSSSVAPVASPASTGQSGEYPQFLGPHRNGNLPGLKLATNWVAQPPTLLWRQPVGPAWSGFAVQGDLAITQEQQGTNECVTAVHRLTGQRVWQHQDAGHYINTLAGEGPRATPTIVGEKVVTFGATGWLNCLELRTGNVLWQRDVRTEHSAGIPEWGFTSAPLVADDRVIVSVGGKPERSLVAYRLSDGEFLWGGGKASPGYSAALATRLAGQEQIVIFNDENLAGHSPTNGAVLWNYRWRRSHPHVAVPIVLDGDQLLVSSGYGTGSALVQIQVTNGTWKANEIWKSTRFRSKFCNPVARAGFAYGLDDGMLACLDLKTGELAWKEGRYGHGQVLLVEDVLLVTAEDGRVMLFAVDPKSPRLITEFKPLSGKCWNPPALAGDLLLVRNETEAACYRVALRP